MTGWIRSGVLACLVLIPALVSALSATAQAQSDWAVVPYGFGKIQQAERAAESVVRALVDRQVSVLSLHETRDRLVSRSRKPNETTAEDRARVREATGRAIEHAAYGRKNEARNEARAVISIAERSMETLNRDSGSARLVLDACLTLVRVDLQARDRRSALEQAKRCRRLVPDLLPRETTHPAEVIGALAEADNQLRRSGAEPLTVQAAGESCPVFMNGRRVGTTPFRTEGSSPGEWRVQVECGAEISRVHAITLGNKPVTLSVNPARDQRIDDRDVLGLRYANEADERLNLADDARALSEELNVGQLVLVRARGAGDALLVRWDRKRDRVVATASLLLDDRGIESLLREEQAERVPAAFLKTAEPDVKRKPAGAAPATAAAAIPDPETNARPAAAQAPHTLPAVTQAAGTEDTNTDAEPRDSSRKRPGLLIGGGILAGVGVATLAAGYGLQVRAQNLQVKAEGFEFGDPAQAAAQSDFESAKNLPYLGIAGSAMAAAAVPILLPNHAPKSALGWALGALAGVVGVGLIAYGATELSDATPLAALLMSSGVPLIEIPITQLVRIGR